MIDAVESTEGWPVRSLEIPPRLDMAALVLVDMQRGYTDRDNRRGRWMATNHPETHEYFFGRIDAIIPNLTNLLEAFRSQGRPVVHVTFGSARADRRDMSSVAHRSLPEWARNPEDLEGFQVGGEEHRIVPELAPLPTEFEVNKTSYSAFTSTPIDLILRSLGATQVVVGGWATNACVELTARDAADRGFEVLLVDDACAAFSEGAHRATIRSFGLFSGGVVSTSSVIDAHEEA